MWISLRRNEWVNLNGLCSICKKVKWKGYKKQKPGFIIPCGREDLPGIALQMYAFKLHLQQLF
jgi:hypothetical protein